MHYSVITKKLNIISFELFKNMIRIFSVKKFDSICIFSSSDFLIFSYINRYMNYIVQR